MLPLEHGVTESDPFMWGRERPHTCRSQPRDVSSFTILESLWVCIVYTFLPSLSSHSMLHTAHNSVNPIQMLSSRAF